MSVLSIGLTGLQAAQRSMEVTSNNIANAETAGYKEVRSQTAASYSGSSHSGVSVVGSVQNFEKRGEMVTTGNSLDLAIEGNGFFVVSTKNGEAYTQAGRFQLDENRFLTTATGERLQGYAMGENGEVEEGTVVDLQIKDGNIPAKASENIDFAINLDADSPIKTLPVNLNTFDPSQGDSYNYAQTTQVYDSLGQSHSLTQYFVHTGTNEWTTLYYLDGNQMMNGANPVSTQWGFNTNGELSEINGQTISATGTPPVRPEVALSHPVGAAGSVDVTLDFGQSSQYIGAFSVMNNDADGYPTGVYTGVKVTEGGMVMASYSNGEELAQGQVVLATFANEQGLNNLNNSLWTTSENSGEALVGAAGEGNLGSISGGRYMSSNVDLSSELVALTALQQHYQANAQAISTGSEMNRILFQNL